MRAVQLAIDHQLFAPFRIVVKRFLRHFSFISISAVLIGLTLAGCSANSGSSDGSSSTTANEPIGLTITELTSGVYDISFEEAAIICEDGSTRRHGFLHNGSAIVREGDFLSVSSGGAIFARGQVGENGSFRLSGSYSGLTGDVYLLLEGWATDTGLVGNAQLIFPNLIGVKCIQATTFTATPQG
jgi:hypothetical protein